MKVKDLLLAGLAVAAMTACSNNDEIVENGIQTTGEEASMSINLKFADEGTRAVTSGTTAPGEIVERDATTVTAIIEYPNTNKRLVFKNLTLVNDGNGNKYTTEKFAVEAASGVKVYAIINNKNENITATTNLSELKVGKQTLPDTGLAYIAKTVAEDNAFLMSGSVEGVNIKGGDSENVAPITVTRVAAKLDEQTVLSTAFPVTATDYNIEGKISVKLSGFSFSNLSSDSYVFGANSSVEGWLQTYQVAGTDPVDGAYEWITDKITYCLENNNTANPTRVHYKGQVCIDDEPIIGDFYIRAISLDGGVTTTYRLFKTWNDLKDFYKSDAIDKLDNTDRTALRKYGIMKYVGGICYYEANITTESPEPAKISVVRNNWYQLTVKSISKIGLPTPAQEPTPDETMLTITTTVADWVIQVNDFDLH
ncbi:Mfa1 family fimbria major subunit [Bacteroides thetaiotaomicron]|uniref:Mfa1 family fimbria major subunit n=1 Tax=Bacteroides thetaiotaomicron TaxID=818 RepID=UPI0021656B30|nr:Mfa1 family fimbria major subunit [Bacteroides thetaiotaomicron]MCS3195845.1 Mfa1 family fimbria major subunit [Bacteroides thetaiotaomicron]